MLRTALSALLHRLHRQQRGQILVMTVLLLSVFGGMTAVAIDLGSYSADRRDLQNAADAIALAASLDLPDEAQARAAADQWALNNGIDPSLMTVMIIPQDLPTEPNPKVLVELGRDHSFVFARLVGISSAAVKTTAAAIKTSASGGAGTIPLSVTQEALDGATLGEEVVLKYDAQDIFNGNTGPIRIDGPGSGNCTSTDNYCTGLQFGADSVICAEEEDPDETFCDGPTELDTQPGNVVGGTRTAIEYRLDNTDPRCAEFLFDGVDTGVFEDDPTTSEPGVYRIREECNPFHPGGYSSLRVLIIPVIDELCNGSCEVDIVDFALFFLEGFGSGGCTGIDCEIVGRFVRVNQSVGLLAGTFDPDSFNVFIRLVE